MKKRLITIKNLNKLPSGKTNWSKVRKMTEEEITKAAKSDPDAPLSTMKQLRKFKRVSASVSDYTCPTDSN